jgi:DNA invertase Pin-like site-specific DNA recombinase
LMERARRGKLHKARQGKVPGRRAPMGFRYSDDVFTVDEPRMAYVRTLFHGRARRVRRRRRLDHLPGGDPHPGSYGVRRAAFAGREREV